jgi:hypothetical protein
MIQSKNLASDYKYTYKNLDFDYLVQKYILVYFIFKGEGILVVS